MAELRCCGLAKAFGERQVLGDVDLTVRGGTLTAILGASGSGKTTLLRIVAGFAAPDHGSVSVDGVTLAEAGRLQVPPDKRAIGYVAQEGALFPHLTVAENVGFGLPRAQRRAAARVLEVLELVGLDASYAARRPHELSGGEQRRVSLGRALAPRPRLVLLDEPFSGLDAHLRSETREAVVAALESEQATAVLVTHDQAEALSMGTEVGVLRAGRLAQTSDPATLYSAPVDLDVARFVGEAVVLPGRVRGTSVECALGLLPLRGSAAEGPAAVMIRPEQIRLARGAHAGSGDGASAEVVGLRYFGPETTLRLVLAGDGASPLLARALGPELPAIGERVALSVAGPVAVYPPEQPQP